MLNRGSKSTGCPPGAHRALRNRRGVSLIETLIVLMLIGTVTAFALPKVRAAQSHESTRSARREVQAAIARAKGAAVQRGCLATLNMEQATDKHRSGHDWRPGLSLYALRRADDDRRGVDCLRSEQPRPRFVHDQHGIYEGRIYVLDANHTNWATHMVMSRKRVKNRKGFTLTEIVLAMTILLIGVLAFVGTSAATSAMLTRGNRATKASFYAQERLEILASTYCGNLVNGTATSGGGVYSHAWTITSALGGNAKRAQLITTYSPRRGFTRADTSEMSVLCLL
jgi:prepilin-type N-terminal cleavage/methylation domain-containing protein